MFFCYHTKCYTSFLWLNIRSFVYTCIDIEAEFNVPWNFIAVLLVLYMCGHVSGRCSIMEIHVATATCLTMHLVDSETDPLVPVLNNSAAVVNFCL